jgi:hypothetical protein
VQPPRLTSIAAPTSFFERKLQSGEAKEQDLSEVDRSEESPRQTLMPRITAAPGARAGTAPFARVPFATLTPPARTAP